MQKHRWLTFLGGALIAGGAGLLGFCIVTQYEAGRAQQEAQAWLDRILKERQAAPPAMAAAKPRLHHGDVVGKLSVPRLHLSVMVFEGDDASVLKRGAGHIPATSLPRQNGNVGIAAHRDTYFRPLRLIRPHDVIEFATPDGVSRYAVTDTEIVRPTDIQVLAKRAGRDLTLVTCYPFYYLGNAPERWIVHAKQIA